jgi:hypothetical protein
MRRRTFLKVAAAVPVALLGKTPLIRTAHAADRVFDPKPGREGNWIAFNTAHDVALPLAATPGTLPFFMYPQAETAKGRRDSLEPDAFRYTIAASELS